MEFDFKSWNARIDEVQAFRPGTPQWNRRIKDEMEKSKMFTERPELYKHDKENKKEKENNSGCFVTTACMQSRGLDDNCEEISILRRFRDNYIGMTPEGQNDILEYYKLAPKIVTSINGKKESKKIYNTIYEKMILSVVNLIKENKLNAARLLCRMYFKNLRETFL